MVIMRRKDSVSWKVSVNRLYSSGTFSLRIVFFVIAKVIFVYLSSCSFYLVFCVISRNVLIEGHSTVLPPPPPGALQEVKDISHLCLYIHLGHGYLHAVLRILVLCGSESKFIFKQFGYQRRRDLFDVSPWFYIYLLWIYTNLSGHKIKIRTRSMA